jgi:hypothetical protein
MREYTGYPLSRIVAGIARIHRRHATRISPRGKLDVRDDDIKYYLMSFGFANVHEFRGTLAARTSPSYARRVVAGDARTK